MAGPDSGPWTREEASASGQVFEFRLWALLTEQSRGHLHVFLPLADRGIDAIVHRLSDDAYLAVQAKGRSSLMGGEVHLVVWADSLRDDDALLVSGLLTEGGMGPTMLVVTERGFKQLAELSTWDGRPVYSMGFGMNPRSDSRWLPHLVPTERLAERFGVTPAFELTEPTSELVVRHLATQRALGLQIKTIGVDGAHPSGTVSVLASSFRPSPTTYFVVLAWHEESRQFDHECLLVPSTELGHIGQLRGAHLSFGWHPGSGQESRLTQYRSQVVDLCRSVARFCLGTSSIT